MIVKRSVTIRGHRTSISIEDEFWRLLRAVADRRDMPLAGVIAEIDQQRPPATNLSSAIRLFVLADVLSRVTDGPGENLPPPRPLPVEQQ
ncbi:ribbon-helix-helix domain-containing protein [Consotaella aegiceratis]|uniref:ribbon-helix-helix domain-containing protein n=1 Tax=Consotaella aegiceratis TaxID=3097961 RepID=UPI002F3EFFED